MDAPVVGWSVLAGAALLDATLGELPARAHPVVWMGRLGQALAVPLLSATPARAVVGGTLIGVGVPCAFGVLAAWTLGSVRAYPPLEIALGALWLNTAFAARGLRAAARDVQTALEANSLQAARTALGALCSRPAADLERDELVGASIESLAENTSDSIVAPLLFFACFGVPGAVLYRAVNTLDAQIGYRGRFEHVGKAAARLDDLLNFIPARVTAVLLVVAGGLLGLPARAGARVALSDHRQTASPNAGWPMAAAAGLLGVELTKRGEYRLGHARHPLGPDRLRIARTLVGAATGLTFAGVALLLWGVRA